MKLATTQKHIVDSNNDLKTVFYIFLLAMAASSPGWIYVILTIKGGIL